MKFAPYVRAPREWYKLTDWNHGSHSYIQLMPREAKKYSRSRRYSIVREAPPHKGYPRLADN